MTNLLNETIKNYRNGVDSKTFGEIKKKAINDIEVMSKATYQSVVLSFTPSEYKLYHTHLYDFLTKEGFDCELMPNQNYMRVSWAKYVDTL